MAAKESATHPEKGKKITQADIVLVDKETGVLDILNGEAQAHEKESLVECVRSQVARVSERQRRT